ncbi:MAG TPA: YwbE family protein [Anaerolineae bacterium]|nr:YwbE family protein [Anaerolineae bacterium]
MSGQRRADIRPGQRVAIVLKKDQRSNKRTVGVVKDILTPSTYHPHGIKVRLEDGRIGRVQAVLSEEVAAEQNTIGEARLNIPSPESNRIRATLIKDDGSSAVPLEVQRRQWEESVAAVELPPGTVIEATSIAGVPCEWITRSEVAPDRAFLFLHGGGFTTGSCRTHRELAARLCGTTGWPILLVDYRLAPEYPFPAGLESVVQVYRGLLAQGFQADRLIVGGDSAGGGLALSAVLALRDRGERLPAALVLLSPWLDLALSGPTIESRAALDPLVSRAGLQACARDYIDQRDPGDPLISPLFAELHDLPPLLIQVGDHEMLLSDSTRLAEKAQAAGVAVTLEVWPAMWHVWQGWAASLPEGQAALRQIGEYVRQTS